MKSPSSKTLLRASKIYNYLTKGAAKKQRSRQKRFSDTFAPPVQHSSRPLALHFNRLVERPAQGFN